MGITPDVIGRIDTLRHKSPAEAYKLALGTLSDPIPPELAPGIHGALGSVLRLLNDFSGAERAIQWGLHLVKDDPFTEGRLYQRLSAVRGQLCDYESAMQFSKKAAARFELTGNALQKTTAVFDQGRILCQAGRWVEGLDTLQEAYERLPVDAADIWRGSFLGQTALAYDGIGRPEEGLVWLRRAQQHQLDPWLGIRRTWTEARLRTSMEDFSTAQELLHQIIEFFDGVNDIEHALAQVELAKCHLLEGATDESTVLLHDLQQRLPLLRLSASY